LKPSAVADVKLTTVDIPAELARLEALNTFDLRGEWRRLHAMQPPKSLSRDLLRLGIAYKIQERSLGGLSKSVRRVISESQTAKAEIGARKRAPSVAATPGTRLLREWHGVTHTVLVHTDGVEWRGNRYKSLSVVAREITGAHWSGPRFFGLRSRQVVPRD
jgi:Protein of unknown function (DUF2924)